jgi:hypothetical protein
MTWINSLWLATPGRKTGQVKRMEIPLCFFFSEWKLVLLLLQKLMGCFPCFGWKLVVLHVLVKSNSHIQIIMDFVEYCTIRAGISSCFDSFTSQFLIALCREQEGGNVRICKKDSGRGVRDLSIRIGLLKADTIMQVTAASIKCILSPAITFWPRNLKAC